MSHSVFENPKLSVTTTPHDLGAFGFNMPVIISNIPLDKNAPQAKSILVMARIDTGTNVTAIDERLATELGLVSIKEDQMRTAGGMRTTRRYMANISFPNSSLKNYTLSVYDCKLPFNGNIADLSSGNFSILLGRDILANWKFVWDGPAATMLISD